MAHGVYSGDVIRANIAVINGCFSLSLPVEIIPVWIRPDFCQQPEFWGLCLIVTPANNMKSKHKRRVSNNNCHCSSMGTAHEIFSDMLSLEQNKSGIRIRKQHPAQQKHPCVRG